MSDVLAEPLAIRDCSISRSDESNWMSLLPSINQSTTVYIDSNHEIWFEEIKDTSRGHTLEPFPILLLTVD